MAAPETRAPQAAYDPRYDPLLAPTAVLTENVIKPVCWRRTGRLVQNGENRYKAKQT